MKILAVLLLVISATKFYLLSTLDREETSYVELIDLPIEDFKKYASLIILTEGLVGLFCALYILFVV